MENQLLGYFGKIVEKIPGREEKTKEYFKEEIQGFTRELFFAYQEGWMENFFLQFSSQVERK